MTPETSDLSLHAAYPINPGPTHTSNFGVKLQDKLKSVGVPCELVYPGVPDVKHPRVQDYLIEKLKAPAAK